MPMAIQFMCILTELCIMKRRAANDCSKLIHGCLPSGCGNMDKRNGSRYVFRIVVGITLMVLLLAVDPARYGDACGER
jgi:hypothetical protein